MNSADKERIGKSAGTGRSLEIVRVQLQKRSGLVKIIVTIQYLHSYVQKSIPDQLR